MQVGGRRAGLVTTAVVASFLAAVLAIGGCTSEAAEPPIRADAVTTSSIATSTTEPSSTTTEPARSFEPLIADPALPLADQVEAAYLFHWEVLSEAGRTGDTSLLPLVFADAALELRTMQLEAMRTRGEAIGGHVEHNYEIAVLTDSEAAVVDGYRSFLTAVDAATGRVLNEPTGRELLYEFRMVRREGRWVVTDVVEYSLPSE